MKLRNETIECLKYIIPVISSYDPNYVISGGFAAIVYGSNRELADIDISVSENVFNQLVERFGEYMIEDHSKINYVDDSWDMTIATFNILDQEVDIFTHTRNKIYSVIEMRWIDLQFKRFNSMKVEGMSLNIITLEELLKYKEHTQREVDLIDIQNLTK